MMINNQQKTIFWVALGGASKGNHPTELFSLCILGIMLRLLANNQWLVLQLLIAPKSLPVQAWSVEFKREAIRRAKENERRFRIRKLPAGA